MNRMAQGNFLTRSENVKQEGARGGGAVGWGRYECTNEMAWGKFLTRSEMYLKHILGYLVVYFLAFFLCVYL
jgi:hypothetical protein